MTRSHGEMPKEIAMPRGGHARSGPAPDPNALRRDRVGDKEWTELPIRDADAVTPKWPLPDLLEHEHDLWVALWQKPQAGMWELLGLERSVAMYVRTFVRANAPDGPISIIPHALRMEAELGLSTVGMNSLRWKFASDEIGERREEAVKPPRASARDRLKALNA